MFKFNISASRNDSELSGQRFRCLENNCDVFFGKVALRFPAMERNLLLFLFRSCEMQIRGQAKFSSLRISDVEISLT